MTDVPQPRTDNPPKVQEVHVIKQGDEQSTYDKLFKEVFGDPGMSKRPAKTTQEVGGIGQIDSLKLPASWAQGESSGGVVGNSMFKEYHSKDDPEVKFCFQYRGHRTSESAAKAFHSLLADQGPHDLKPAELASLKEVLGRLGNAQDFTTTSAKTEDLNGKRVLTVEGTYNKWNLSTKHVFIDSDRTGSAVQEIYFIAPKADYAKYSQTANQAFDSISWKGTF